MAPEMNGCSILVIASSRDHSLDLVRRLLHHPDSRLSNSEEDIPWKITNKYYSADVSFHIRQLSTWIPAYSQLDSIPAVVFVWVDGEPYKDLLQLLQQKLSAHEFEVVLAIRIPRSSLPQSTTPISEQSLPTPKDEIESSQSTEDDQDVDAYMSAHGFEFIDIQDSSNAGSIPDSDKSVDRSGALGLPRVIDALSTIMWPSMIQNTRKKDRAQNLLTDDETQDSLSILINGRTSGDGLRERQDRMQRELEALESWLNEDNSDDNSDETNVDQGAIEKDPWNLASRTPTSGSSTPGVGFEDDFAAFVSAPPIQTTDLSLQNPPSSTQRSRPFKSSFSSTFSFDSASSTSGRSTPTLGEHDDAHLAPTSIPYKSLGSVSDLGDPDEYMHADNSVEDNGDDGDIPTKDEIAATTRRIFGSTPLTISPTAERSIHSSLAPDMEETQAVRPSSSLESSSVSAILSTIPAADLEAFDMQNVLSTLQCLKDEISGMSDSKERRRAAARVALGLVYGLHDGDEM
ncbi:hypothetical protein BJ138DRAFT_1083423 [Hygrophoropsis aurantiaca]|uniref:Uncharacterized protein n=1 Tax=Hygrophoropsis aurantiaca TaxID=72124 RepID=A0ACB8AH24_9AGAM|nr:hypothetical protein BJ138DRAFT_1083423 [Hygrophoropsis aurantiaca]